MSREPLAVNELDRPSGGRGVLTETGNRANCLAAEECSRSPRSQRVGCPRPDGGIRMYDRLLWAVGATCAALLVLVGCSSTPPVDPATSMEEPATTSTNAPTSTVPSQADLEAKIEALEIPAGLEPQQLAEAFIEIKNKWWNAGTEDPQVLKDRRDNEGTSWAKLAPIIAQENKAIYAPALFGADWESNPEAVTAVERMVEANESVLSNFMATAYRGSGAVGYKAWSELTETSANASTTGSRILRVDYSNHDNGSENTVGTGAISPGGSVIVDWKVVDDKEYAIAID